MTKRIFLTIFSLLALFSCASAHSGRTDSNGGHYVTATGEYHFHHGYPAHQHPGGVCSYLSNSPSTKAIAETDDYDEDYDIGYNDGFDDGYSDGYEKGHFDGYEKGHAEGFNTGRDEGFNNGYDRGHEEGYSEGHSTVEDDLGILVLILIVCVALALRRSSAQSKKEEQFNEQIRYLESELTLAHESQAELQDQLAAVRYKLKQCPPRLLEPPQPPVSPQPPAPSKTAVERISTFGKWPPTSHDSEKQYRKFIRANTESLELLERNGSSAHIIGTSGHVYATSLERCNCPDFEMNEHGKAPCKHIYFLAMQLGIPVKDIFEEYIKP